MSTEMEKAEKTKTGILNNGSIPSLHRTPAFSSHPQVQMLQSANLFSPLAGKVKGRICSPHSIMALITIFFRF
jgi:hypothetical protein